MTGGGIAEIESTRLNGIARRPRIVLSPFVGAGFESGRFGEMRVGRVAQPIVEPRLEDVLAVIERRVRSEVDRAEPSAIAVPSAMIPRSRHEIVATIAIVGLHLLVDLLRSVEILLIP